MSVGRSRDQDRERQGKRAQTEPSVPVAASDFLAWRLSTVGSVLRLVRSRVLRDAGMLGVGALVSQGMLFLAAPVFLRHYRPADLGSYSFAYGLVALAATFSSWNVERLIVVVPSRATAVRLLAALFIMAVAAAGFLLVLAGLAQVAAGMLPMDMRNSLSLLWAAPLSMFLVIALVGTRYYLIRVRRFRAIAVAQISRSLIFVAGTLATGLYWDDLGGPGAMVMFGWQIAGDAGALLVQICANGRVTKLLLHRPRLRRSLTVVLRRRRTVGALALSQVINSINHQLPLSIVAIAFGSIYAGWYVLAVQLVYAPCNIITLAVRDVANQRFASSHAEHRPFAHEVLRVTFCMAVVGAIPFAAFIFVAPKFLPPLLGPQWGDASQSVSIVAVASYFWFIVAPAESVALIVDARRFIVLWYVLRMMSLAGSSAAALGGALPYHTWLALIVAGDTLLYLLQAVAAYLFARAAEARFLRVSQPLAGSDRLLVHRR
jgi:O-antigen/teichoic acid export membrane protein